MEIEFIRTTREEYEKIKKELNSRFKFARVRLNNQQYAMGGFNVNPKDYKNGFNPKQIDSLCIFLGCLGYDDEGLNLLKNEVYTNENTMSCSDEFLNTKKKHLILKEGFSFLMKIKNYEEVKEKLK